MSVKVAVRVRPFNRRELGLDSEQVVEMKGRSTLLFEPGKKGAKPRQVLRLSPRSAV